MNREINEIVRTKWYNGLVIGNV